MFYANDKYRGIGFLDSGGLIVGCTETSSARRSSEESLCYRV